MHMETSQLAVERRDCDVLDVCVLCAVASGASGKPSRPYCTPEVTWEGSKWLRCWFESLLLFSYCLFVLSVFLWRSGKGRRKHKIMCCYIVRKPR